MINYSLMPGDSNHVFRVLKTALVALLVCVALTLFGLRYLQHLNEANRTTQPVTASQANSPATDTTPTLFKSIKTQPPQPATQPATAGIARSTDQVKTVEPAENSNLSATIKQRDQIEQVNSRFIKTSFNGKELEPTAAQWSCARDQETGLLWEVKLFNAGVSDAEHTYSWYSTGSANPGLANGGRCFGTLCDTQAYIDEMNRLELCASSAWRLPDFTELDGLIDRNYYNPTINQEIFPHAQGTVYWTSTQLENNSDMVMQIDFFNGMSTAVRKDLSYSLRLVSP